MSKSNSLVFDGPTAIVVDYVNDKSNRAFVCIPDAKKIIYSLDDSIDAVTMPAKIELRSGSIVPYEHVCGIIGLAAISSVMTGKKFGYARKGTFSDPGSNFAIRINGRYLTAGCRFSWDNPGIMINTFGGVKDFVMGPCKVIKDSLLNDFHFVFTSNRTYHPSYVCEWMIYTLAAYDNVYKCIPFSRPVNILTRGYRSWKTKGEIVDLYFEGVTSVIFENNFRYDDIMKVTINMRDGSPDSPATTEQVTCINTLRVE